MEPDITHENESAANPIAGFRYQTGSVVANTAKTNAMMAVAFVWFWVLYSSLKTVVGFSSAIGIGDGTSAFLLGLMALLGFGVALPIVMWVQKVMRYTEVDFDNRVIRGPSNNISPFGIPRRKIPFTEVGNIRLVSRPQSNGKSLHRFDLLPYQSSDAITSISQMSPADVDPNVTLAALKQAVVSVDTPSDAVFSSALARVPAVASPRD